MTRFCRLASALFLTALLSMAGLVPSARAADPSTFSGLDCWLKYNAGVTLTAGQVTGLADQSGAGHNASAPSAGNVAPSYLYGPFGAISFDAWGTDNASTATPASPKQYLQLSPTLSHVPNSSSYFLVVDHTCNLTSQNQYVNFGGNSQAGLWKWFSQIAFNDGSFHIATALPVRSSLEIIGVVSSANGTDLYTQDGHWSTSPNALGATPQTGGYLMVGFNGGGALSTGTLGDFKEFLHYNRALTQYEVVSIFDILEATYHVPTSYIANVVCEGDSETASSFNRENRSYPAMLEDSLGPSYRVSNFGAPGQQVSTMLANRAANIDPLLNAGSRTNVLIVWGGTNDLSSQGGNQTPAQAWARLVSYGQAARAVGWKTLLVSTLPRPTGALGGSGGPFETDRTALNSLERTNYTVAFDEFADEGADPIIGLQSNTANPQWYQADGTHLTNAGYGIAEKGIERTLLRLLSPVAVPTPALTLTIRLNGSNQPVLTWVSDPLATSYNVYRALAGAGYGLPLVTVAAPSTTYTDTSAPSGTVRYTIQPVH